ncbi:MAG: GHKL domain-containing protein [Butyrivibrio sp.]|nr:GHKL domain-containing protein [Butyrivibrio sp.]
MKRTLYLKFLLAYLLFGIFGFVVVATFVYGMTYDRLRRDKADSMYQMATQIANTYAADLYNSETSLDTVYHELRSLSIYMDSSPIWIVNPSGRLVLDSARALGPGEEIIIEGFDPTVTGSSYYTIGNFWGSFNQDMLSVFAPITANYKVQAYVVIHTGLAALQEKTNTFLNISYLMLIVLFLLSLIILIFFTELVYVPLRKITTATEQYAAGNMGYEFSVESEDEMGYLAASLSYMAGEIARQEEDQKKFIANVSHDFRSPLTSIRGYLVAMQDGTIPVEMYDRYLGIVINETDRLTKLTNEMLTLNNMSTKGMLLDKSDFDINRTIRNVAASFEGTCREKKIAIELVLTDDKMLVNADMSKIQQVLYNLLDNAIKFSHHDSSIKIETTEKHSKVFVSVKDSGIGIPKDDQKMIFDRFYKSDLSRGKDKKGTGLGLAIVKEIVKAHDENINVISTEGVGTEFIFSLPKAQAMDEEDDE